MSDLFWFTVFVIFFVVIPFKWWQTVEVMKEQEQFLLKKIRNLEDTKQSYQHLAQQYAAEKHAASLYKSLYEDNDAVLLCIEEYILDSEFADTPEGIDIINLINGNEVDQK